mmetsp:Transcript_107507/g.335172  ORF Transcript_107507/g.335172 Transcript_107507/m.335172 type:complete len:320 (-) Transcript_107507:209-1168(-)
MARLRHRGVGDVPVAGVNRRGHAGVDGTAIAPHSAGQEPHEALHVPSDGHVGLQTGLLRPHVRRVAVVPGHRLRAACRRGGAGALPTSPRGAGQLVDLQCQSGAVALLPRLVQHLRVAVGRGVGDRGDRLAAVLLLPAEVRERAVQEQLHADKLLLEVLKGALLTDCGHQGVTIRGLELPAVITPALLAKGHDLPAELDGLLQEALLPEARGMLSALGREGRLDAARQPDGRVLGRLALGDGAVRALDQGLRLVGHAPELRRQGADEATHRADKVLVAGGAVVRIFGAGCSGHLGLQIQERLPPARPLRRRAPFLQLGG